MGFRQYSADPVTHDAGRDHPRRGPQPRAVGVGAFMTDSNPGHLEPRGIRISGVDRSSQHGPYRRTAAVTRDQTTNQVDLISAEGNESNGRPTGGLNDDGARDRHRRCRRPSEDGRRRSNEELFGMSCS
jgi:hypothetical protein